MGTIPVLSYVYEVLAKRGPVRKSSHLAEGFVEDVVAPLFMFWGDEPPPSSLTLVPGVGGGSRYSTYIGKTDRGTAFYFDPMAIQAPIIAVLGKPGSGKSVLTKSFIYRFSWNNPDIPIIIVDPEDEYTTIVERLGGKNVYLGDTDYLNIFDTPHPDINPYTWARDTVLSTLKKILEISEKTSSRQVSILERAIVDSLKNRRISEVDKTTWTRPMPTLLDIYLYIKRLSETTDNADERRSALALVKKLEMIIGPGKHHFSWQSTFRLNEAYKYRILNIVTKGVPRKGRDLVTDYVVKYFSNLLDYIKEIGGTMIRLVLVVDEAYIVFRKSKDEVNDIEELVRRLRKYGIMVWASTQRIEELKDTLLPHASAIFIGLITTDKEKRAIAEGLGMPKHYAEMIPKLQVGRFIVKLEWRKKNMIPHGFVPFLVNVESALGNFKRVSLTPPDTVEVRDYRMRFEPRKRRYLVNLAELLNPLRST